MQKRMISFGLTVVVILVCSQFLPPSQPPCVSAAPSVSLFGLNMYITGRERSDEEAAKLVEMAKHIGLRWTREELSWASWGKVARNDFFDKRIRLLSDAGIRIIGMLLTTPSDYQSPECKAHAAKTNQPKYWCAPTDPQAYAHWAAMVVERYDADGVDDAPGSPRVDAWEIWNEPDIDGTWLPQADPAAYAWLQRAGYDAIKRADPTALVLNGGVMTFDGVGTNHFMQKVVDVAGWDSFDVLSLHPWLLDHAPDDPRLINRREQFDVTIPGRLALAQSWIDSHGGRKPIWITEVGWSTCGNRCESQFAKSDEQQADYMVRVFVLAAAMGVQHVSYFQFEDKFDNNHTPWSQAAILNQNLSPKPAYFALGTLIAQLQHAQYQGTGPLHQPGVLADYRFTLLSGGVVDVLWTMSGTRTVDMPLEPGLTASLIHRDGPTEPLPASSSAPITLSERPIYVRQSSEATQFFPETGQRLSGRFLSYWQAHGDVPILGLPVTAVRSEQGTDRQWYDVQWLERARLELHPENAPPYDVLLALLGVDVLAKRGINWRTLPTVDRAAEGCRYVPETSHSLCPPFRAFWEEHGGLPVFGFPISEPMNEINSDDGKSYMVQYFERNRLEYHPELEPPYNVLLGRLGVELSIR